MRRRAPRSSRGACGARRPPDPILTELKFEQGRRRDLERERANSTAPNGSRRRLTRCARPRSPSHSRTSRPLLAASIPQARQAPMARRLGSPSSPSRCLTVEFSGNGWYSPLFSRVLPLSVKGTEGRGKASNGHCALPPAQRGHRPSGARRLLELPRSNGKWRRIWHGLAVRSLGEQCFNGRISPCRVGIGEPSLTPWDPGRLGRGLSSSSTWVLIDCLGLPCNACFRQTFAKGLCNACGSARAPHGSRVDQASWRAAWAFLMLRCCARRCETVGFSASGMLGLGLA